MQMNETSEAHPQSWIMGVGFRRSGD
uniref:Uncharacterized protein n=1 Tax=Anguilla anguilla TaxID=7936 RepID=A0A0E9RD03_ANGAN